MCLSQGSKQSYRLRVSVRVGIVFKCLCLTLFDTIRGLRNSVQVDLRAHGPGICFIPTIVVAFPTNSGLGVGVWGLGLGFEVWGWRQG